jgi:hypothetical protein
MAFNPFDIPLKMVIAMFAEKPSTFYMAYAQKPKLQIKLWPQTIKDQNLSNLCNKSECNVLPEYCRYIVAAPTLPTNSTG